MDSYTPIERNDDVSDWNSHINMQKLVRNRTKLETPNDIDIASYARAKQQNFIEKYQRSQTKQYEDRLIYTQPYSTDHYSEPHENRRKMMPSKKITNDAYTSITSSDQFLSSNSVSIPGANSTSNTTTHQYDTRTSVGIQTTYSLTRSTPIFGLKASGLPTRRINKMNHNKQQQAMPEAVAYILTFDDEVKSARSMGAKRSSQYLYAAADPALDRHEPSSSGNISSMVESKEVATLQQCLQSGRPQFMTKAEERRKCLNEIHNLRQKRNEQRHKLFLLSSNNSLRANMKYLNPPPMTMRRVFTTKGLKACSRHKYKQLPEIRRKEEIERLNKIKRSTRIVTDMFNRNLQRRVLRGQTDLSNSMTVTQ